MDNHFSSREIYYASGRSRYSSLDTNAIWRNDKFNRASRAAKGSKLLNKDKNLTHLESASAEYRSESPNLLKQFQECVKDREPYPMVQLTCSEYGKLSGRGESFLLEPPPKLSFRDSTIDSVAACGRRRSVYGNLRVQKRIVGGVESAPGDWPFLAALLGGPEQIFYCAGVLIADQWVLTASHCVGK